jgi:alpha-galactosidase
MSELYREYGYLPYAADRHTCEFLPGLITPTPEALQRFRLVRTSIEQRYENRANARNRAKQYASGELAPPERTRETAVDIITAFVSGQPFMDIANLPNVGQVDNLPRRAVVETLGQCDGLGFRALTAGSLPEPIRALVEPHCHVQLQTLQAALTGNRKLAIESLRMDPVCAHLAPSQVRAMGDELLAAGREWLPQFR